MSCRVAVPKNLPRSVLDDVRLSTISSPFCDIGVRVRGIGGGNLCRLVA